MKEKALKYSFFIFFIFVFGYFLHTLSSLSYAKVKKSKSHSKVYKKEAVKKNKVSKTRVVKKGDNLHKVAKKPELRVEEYIHYKVKKGETLYRISKKFGVTTEEIAELNGVTPKSLKPGLIIKIPNKNLQNQNIVERNLDLPVKGELSEKKIYHEVKKGENLFRIALKYETTVEELKKLNNLKNNHLKPGQLLLVKVKKENSLSEAPPGFIYHVVQEGETLYRISLKYNIPLNTLKEINHLKEDILVVGQKLKIPTDLAYKERPFVLERPKEITSEKEETLSQKFEKNVLLKKGVLSSAMLTEEKEKALKQKFLEISFNLADQRYKLGGDGNGYLDCSAFVKLVYEELGIKLPRSSVEQYQIGVPIEKEELIPGDLVFFKTRGNKISHVGIYIGDNRFIHISSSRKRVAIDSLDDPYFNKRYAGAKRVLNGEVLEYFQDYLNKNKGTKSNIEGSSKRNYKFDDSISEANI
ncbi:MAG: LysM peptidoglycan-binding domain-containing protein [Caldimicrobium sp.]